MIYFGLLFLLGIKQIICGKIYNILMSIINCIDMKVGVKKNDGVSPVIGTILLVAITVVLVAIISAVVMGMTGDIGTTHTVGIKMSDNESESATGNVSITFLSGDISSLQGVYVYGKADDLTNLSNKTFTIGKVYDAHVGSGSQTVTVVGKFSDGNQTILTQTITVS